MSARAARPTGAECSVALLALREGRHEDGKRCGRDDGRAKTLKAARRDQRCFTPGEAGQQRRKREEDGAAHEHAPPAEQVSRTTTEQEEAPEEQRVGADHPLEVRLRKAEGVLDRGERHVHDRDVEHDHELHRAEERERKPLSLG